MARAEVLPVGEFRNVLPKVLLRDVNVGAADAEFQSRPKAFDAVGVNQAAHVFAA